MEQKEQQEKNIQNLLLELAHIYFLKVYNQLEEFGLHPGQVPVMKAIYHREGMSQRELADWLHIKPPTVAVSIKRMEKNGLVERRPDEKDQRVTRIYLTDYGREINGKIKHVLEENETALIAGFEEGEIYLFRRFFKQMIQNVRNTMPEKEKEKTDFWENSNKNSKREE